MEEGGPGLVEVGPVLERDRGDLEKAAYGRECSSHRRDLGAAGHRPGTVEDGDLVEDEGRILHEDGVGQVRVGRQMQDRAAQIPEAGFVPVVLLSGELEVDRLPRKVGQLASGQGRADAAGDR